MADPTLVYDDDCGFCAWWARQSAQRAAVQLVGFSEVTPEIRDRLPADYEACAHLLVDGEVYSCGESIEQLIVRSEAGEGLGPLVDFLRNVEEYGRLRERAYRAVADRRDVLGQFVSADSPGGSDSGR